MGCLCGKLAADGERSAGGVSWGSGRQQNISGGAAGRTACAHDDTVLTPREVLELAQKVVDANSTIWGGDVDAIMLAALALVRSCGRVRGMLQLQPAEDQGHGVSAGLCQMPLSTATWLSSNVQGCSCYGDITSVEQLYDPATAMYLAAAYLSHLATICRMRAAAALAPAPAEPAVVHVTAGGQVILTPQYMAARRCGSSGHAPGVATHTQAATGGGSSTQHHHTTGAMAQPSAGSGLHSPLLCSSAAANAPAVTPCTSHTSKSTAPMRQGQPSPAAQCTSQRHSVDNATALACSSNAGPAASSPRAAASAAAARGAMELTSTDVVVSLEGLNPSAAPGRARGLGTVAALHGLSSLSSAAMRTPGSGGGGCSTSDPTTPVVGLPAAAQAAAHPQHAHAQGPQTPRRPVARGQGAGGGELQPCCGAPPCSDEEAVALSGGPLGATMEEYMVRAYHCGPKACWSAEGDRQWTRYSQAASQLQLLRLAMDAWDLTSPGPVMHVVAQGETLPAIARALGVTVQAILDVNPDITDASQVAANDCIALPVGYVLPRLHCVQPGETLSAIAKAKGVSLHRLLLRNPELVAPAPAGAVGQHGEPLPRAASAPGARATPGAAAGSVYGYCCSNFAPGWVLAIPGLQGHDKGLPQHCNYPQQQQQYPHPQQHRWHPDDAAALYASRAAYHASMPGATSLMYAYAPPSYAPWPAPASPAAGPAAGQGLATPPPAGWPQPQGVPLGARANAAGSGSAAHDPAACYTTAAARQALYTGAGERLMA